MKRADRRELAVLGLVVLGWGLLVSPLLHRDAHAHGVAHTHGPSGKHVPVSNEQHGADSLEHQAVAFTSAPALPDGVVALLAVKWTHDVEPGAPWVAAPRRVEQSQAP